MVTRIGKVTKIYPREGRVKVTFEDSESSSLPLAVLTMNKEYSMPSVGDRVITLHMENGTSKGFVLGTYYGGGMQPKANSGYRKDFTSGCYAICIGGAYTLKGSKILLSGSSASVSLGTKASIVGSEAVMGSSSSDDDDEADEPDSYFKVTFDSAEIKGATEVKVEAEGGAATITAGGGAAEVVVDTDTTVKASTVTIETDGDLIFKCAYGTITAEEIMKRLERIEDQLGIPHTI